VWKPGERTTEPALTGPCAWGSFVGIGSDLLSIAWVTRSAVVRFPHDPNSLTTDIPPHDPAAPPQETCAGQLQQAQRRLRTLEADAAETAPPALQRSRERGSSATFSPSPKSGPQWSDPTPTHSPPGLAGGAAPSEDAGVQLRVVRGRLQAAEVALEERGRAAEGLATALGQAEATALKQAVRPPHPPYPPTIASEYQRRGPGPHF